MPEPQPPSPREPDAASEAVLVGLVSRMDDGQRLRLKVLLVEQAVAAVARCLRVGDDDSGGVIVAREWLAEPTADRADRAAVYVIFDRIDGGARYSDYPGFFLAPADAAGSDDVLFSARVARRAVAAAAVYARSNSEWFARGETADDFAAAERAALEFQITEARECLAKPGRPAEPPAAPDPGRE